MKIIFGLFYLWSQFLYANPLRQDCESLFQIRETQALEALNCFEILSQMELSNFQKTSVHNRISYLHFFIGIHVDDSKKLEQMQNSLDGAKIAAEALAPWLDENKYKALTDLERRGISTSLYLYGTALAAKAEIQGNLAVIAAWPEIQKVMKLILRLGHVDVEGYGAYRTLAIANTRIPAIAGGDKKLAEQYFKLILNKTNEYPSNTIGWVDLLLRLDRTAEACSQLKALVDLTDGEIAQKKPGILEVTKDLKEAALIFENKCN